MGKLLELMTNEAVANTGSVTKSLIVEEVNVLHFQVDHAVAENDMADLIVRVYTNNKSIVDDIDAYTLMKMWLQNSGAVGDATDSSFSIDLGAYHLEDKEELSVYLYNGNAETETIDCYAECNNGLAPKQIRYQKRQDGNFTMENCDELWLTGAALDESTTIVNINDRSTPIKAFWVQQTNYGISAEDKTIVKVHDNDVPAPITVNTAYALSTYFFVVVSTSFEEATIAKATAKAVSLAKKAVRKLPKKSVDSAIASGQLPPRIRNIGGVA